MNDTSNWSRGYPVNESYPAAWHMFESPAHLRAICAVMGVAWEVDADTPLAVAEVGCGTGYTAHMLAAGNPGWQVVGLDYNPAHIAEARSMAAAAAIGNLRFIEADLAEIGDADLDRLPEFDLVAVHGLWSWVADPVRDGVLRLLRRRLKPGGLALVTYNAMPGAANGLGLARLVRASMRSAADGGDAVAAASQLVQRLLAAEPAHLPPSAWRRVLTGELKGARPSYLRHEFQTDHWRPSFHAEVATAMASARCDYIGSATIDENFPQMSLTPAQLELWEQAQDAPSRELIFDLCVPRAFRRDLYVRGLRRVSRDEAAEALWFTSAVRTQGELVLTTQAGEAKLPQPLVDAVRSALADSPRPIGELRMLPGCGNVNPSELVAALIGTGCAAPLWRMPGSGDDWAQAAASARRLNAVTAQRLARFGIGSGQLGLASPALGGGLQASALELAIVQLVAEPADAGADACDAGALVRRLVPRGQMPPDEVRTALEHEVTTLLEERLPVWRALGIVPGR